MAPNPNIPESPAPPHAEPQPELATDSKRRAPKLSPQRSSVPIKVYMKSLQAYNLPPKKLFRKKPKYTVTVDSGIERAKTGVANGESPVWTDDLAVELTAGGKLSIVISRKDRGGFEDIGICERAYDDVVKELPPVTASSRLVKWPVQSLLGTVKSQNMWLGFFLTSRKSEDETQGDPNAQAMGVVPGAAEVRIGSSERVDGLDIPSSRNLVDQVANIAEAPSSQPALRAVYDHRGEISTVSNVVQGPAFVGLEQILRGLEPFCKLFEATSEIHPYAKVAMTVLSLIPKTLFAELDREDCVRDTCTYIGDIFSFMDTASPIQTFSKPSLKNQQIILSRLIQQVTECCRFILDYSKRQEGKGFVARALRNGFSLDDIRKKAGEFKTTIDALKQNFIDESAVSIQVSVLRLSEAFEEFHDDFDIRQLKRPEDATFRTDKGCLAGTRVQCLDYITKWIEDPAEEARALLLLGFAGSGKSSIAHEIARRYHSMRRLGSSFYFNRSESTSRPPHALFTNMARDLADFDPAFKRELAHVLKNETRLTGTHDCNLLFKRLIREPAGKSLNNSAVLGPIVVVVDALDESGQPNDRKALLAVLAQELASLPSHFRFLITSRSEPDIRALPDIRTLSRATSSPPFFSLKDLRNDFSKDIDSDIQNYIRHCFQSSSLGREGAQQYEDLFPQLTKKAERLFQWAYVACNWCLNKQGPFVAEAIQAILNSSNPSNSHDHESPLDAVYDIVLKSFLEPPKILDLFRHVLALVFSAFEPGLTQQALLQMYQSILATCVDYKVDHVQYILNRMGSVLSGVGTLQSDIPIQPLHTSFRDFLLDERRSGDFHITPNQLHHRDLALAGLGIMNSSLSFNMCSLETSYVRNVDVPDFASRRQKWLSQTHSPAIGYSSLFWAEHLQSVFETVGSPAQPHHAIASVVVDTPSFQVEIGRLVKEWVEEKLIFWIEALGLLGSISNGHAARSLTGIVSWVQHYLPDSKMHMVAMLQDALRFINTFAPCIAISTSHLYLSALQLAPKSSLIRRQYSHFLRPVLRFVEGAMASWPSEQIVVPFSGYVLCVDISSDGSRFVVGLSDHTIHIMNTATGGQISHALEGHTDSATSVALSADGKRIISGSDDRTVRMWDAETVAQIGHALEGHMDCVRSVAVSEDGKRVVSGSDDGTVRIWDTEKGEQIGHALKGHTDRVTSVAVSADGKRIISGSDDRTVRMWDVETSKQIGHALEGHTAGGVMSVAVSADGKRIISGSSDQTVRMWDAETGAQIGHALKGHTDWVRSVVLSADGKRIISGSDDRTVRMWDVETGTQIGPALEGHTHSVTSVAVSEDGKRIVSGSDDQTVRMWDAETGAQIGHTPEGHAAGGVTSVAVSADSKPTVSGSDDRTVWMWDAETGAQICHALEGHAGGVTSVVDFADSKPIIPGSWDETVRMWDAETGVQIGHTLEGHMDWVTSVAVSADGKRIVSGSSDQTVRMWGVETGAQIGHALEGHSDWVRSIVLSADGKRIVSGSDDRTVRMWDAEAVAQIGHALEGHTDCVRSVAVSADGKCVVSGSDDRTVRMWDTETGEQIGHALEGHTDCVRSVAVSADGKRIVSGSDDQTVRMWDAETGEQIGHSLKGHMHWVTSVVVSVDGKRIVSGSSDRTVWMWDAETGEQIGHALEGHTHSVTSIAVSADGKRIISGSDDQTVRMWDVETGAQIGHALEGHTNRVTSIALSADGKCIVSGSDDQTVRVWDIDINTSQVPTGSVCIGFSRDKERHRLQHVGRLTAELSHCVEGRDLRDMVRLDKDGWIVFKTATERRLIAWIPAVQRYQLYMPRTKLIIGGKHASVQLDMSEFTHGTEWTKCYIGPTPSDSDATSS
ncbi:hypothetical protein K488DRAFT_89761 [Vararia minispora EC-137]|uniref:Uncharacterized protein n=1 Tax=Vararia minispora EC-137 TaxID=1314806 RepID=A0ACB8Q9Y7_9AGAM|nr:hypothetical protein K488DRAFT_89761 [Vararia minispora EC-137]